MKRILVTGAAGMIGRELIELIYNKEKCHIRACDIKNNASYPITNNMKKQRKLNLEIVTTNLKYYDYCLRACKDVDEIYHLVGVKGNPKMTNEKPADFMKMLQFDSNMIYAAQEMGVKKFLYTSSIAILNPQSDKYPARAKKTGEMLCEAMRIQYPNGTKYFVIRPANVYGRYDNFDNPDAMVITSLISKAKKDKLEVWGDGSQERDFINAKDVARGMIKTMEVEPNEPINLCSGITYKIKDVVDILEKELNIKAKYNPEKNVGKAKRVMPNNLDLINFKPEVSLEEGIKEICQYLQK